jgi:hypothetical protein
MLYHCEYTWHPGTTLEEVNQLLAQGNTHFPQSGVRVKGYYRLVGGGAGFMLLEADDPDLINQFLVPTMGLIAWDVRQVIEDDFARTMANAAQQVSEAQPAS